MTDTKQPSKGRRQFFTRAGAIPISIVALNQLPAAQAESLPATPTDTPYQYTFFTEAELGFLAAACERFIPTDEHGPGAVDAGVLEFLDRHMQTPYAAGAIWYMQGPFQESKPQFGYQGKLALKDIIKVGIADFDAYCRNTFKQAFKDLSVDQQETLLKDASAGKLPFENISSKVFVKYLLEETRNGFFADPIHGGNKDMAGWKLIGYPGMRGDYLDWVSVRDKPYPLPPVSLSGKRG